MKSEFKRSESESCFKKDYSEDYDRKYREFTDYLNQTRNRYLNEEVHKLYHLDVSKLDKDEVDALIKELNEENYSYPAGNTCVRLNITPCFVEHEFEKDEDSLENHLTDDN